MGTTMPADEIASSYFSSSLWYFVLKKGRRGFTVSEYVMTLQSMNGGCENVYCFLQFSVYHMPDLSKTQRLSKKTNSLWRLSAPETNSSYVWTYDRYDIRQIIHVVETKCMCVCRLRSFSYIWTFRQNEHDNIDNIELPVVNTFPLIHDWFGDLHSKDHPDSLVEIWAKFVWKDIYCKKQPSCSWHIQWTDRPTTPMDSHQKNPRTISSN